MYSTAVAIRPQCAPIGAIDYEQEARRERGYYRRRYRAFATSGGWGVEGAGCGSSVLVRYKLGELAIMPVLCDTWACHLCGTRRAAWFKRQANRCLDEYGLAYFWTLTIRRSDEPSRGEQIASFYRAKASWNILRTNLVRDFGKFSYVWVVESTKAGIAHLHLLCSLDVDPSELARRWELATGDSYVVDVEPIESGRAADYLAKYITQQVGDRPAELKGTRVFSKSRDVQFEPFRRKSDDASAWFRWSRPYWDAIGRLVQSGADLLHAHEVGVPAASFRDTNGLVAGVPVRLSYSEYDVDLAGGGGAPPSPA